MLCPTEGLGFDSVFTACLFGLHLQSVHAACTEICLPNEKG